MFNLLSCNSKTYDDQLNIEPAVNFPQWLIHDNHYGDQTSGITFIKTDSAGIIHFLIADDIGKIQHLEMTNDSISAITPIFLSSEANEFLLKFPKQDFEEILFDRYNGNVYLSIEGNGAQHKEFTGIFKLNFADDNIYSDTILSIEKLNIRPDSLFKKYLDYNIGYEGFASDENYFYLGFEGFPEKEIFADSTVIFIVDKSSLEIIKEINTKQLGIHTICGLYSDKNNSLYGVDRNNKKIFHMLFDNSLNISEFASTIVETNIPNYSSFNYVASLESITMDENNFLYLIVDPWKTYFIPSEEILVQLDNFTVNNFKKFIPVIYKFKLKN